MEITLHKTYTLIITCKWQALGALLHSSTTTFHNLGAFSNHDTTEIDMTLQHQLPLCPRFSDTIYILARPVLGDTSLTRPRTSPNFGWFLSPSSLKIIDSLVEMKQPI